MEKTIQTKHLPLAVDAELAEFILDGTEKGNILTAANGNALLWCMSKSEGKIVIVDVFKERLDGIQYYLDNTVSESENDVEGWKNFLKEKAPSAYDTVKDFITPERYEILSDRMERGDIKFLLIDLSLKENYSSIFGLFGKGDSETTINFLDMRDEILSLVTHMETLGESKEVQKIRMKYFQNNLIKLMSKDSKIILGIASRKRFSLEDFSKIEMGLTPYMYHDIKSEKDLKDANDFSIRILDEISRLVEEGIIEGDYLPLIADIPSSEGAGKFRVSYK